MSSASPLFATGTRNEGNDTLTLRRATSADAELLWQWANDDEVRRFAFQSAVIPWAAHVRWVERKLASADSSIWIASDARGAPVGQIRFDGDGAGVAMVDLSVAGAQRGRGYGSAMLRSGAIRLFEDSRWQAIAAWIKPENASSLRSFDRAGFRCLGQREIGGHRATGYRLPRP